ncbi:YqhV family protein [Halobacillus shinanisalinarum]|uniref:YqhV family protein n=1 Tax=Halobacillus shinanisalinarum TaxID=2932258 RepID=A0ABY4GXP3_9BACI|nr:YqhV family protein [Halobacillus shinanisalinarum]UOQ92192.1 YqhV family protein [Halobacillus shinanisalinarum]
MWLFVEKAVLAMVILRLISGFIEITAALLMLKLNELEKAIMINTSLALVGPFILVATTTVGLLGMVDRISYPRLACIVGGVALILIGVKMR